MNATTNRRPRALLLDDDPTVLRLLGTALEARGFDVRAALDGEAGLALLVDELLELDVVVADDALPVRDAPSLLRLLRDEGGEHDLAVVVLGDASARARERLLALGADDVVDRAHGPLAAVEAVLAVLRRRARAGAPSPRSAPEVPPPAWRSALAAARGVLSPATGLDPLPA